MYRPQPRKRIQRRQRTPLRPAFQTFAQQQKSNDQQHRIEINLSSRRRCDRRISGVRKRYARSQAHQRVHVRCAVAQRANCAHINPASRPRHHQRRHRQQKPPQSIRRDCVEPRTHTNQEKICCAHLASQRHRQQHRRRTRRKRHPCLQVRACRPIFAVPRALARPRQHGIVSGPANRFYQLLRRSQRWIKHHARPVRHQIHARLLHARRPAQRFLNVMLATGARHPQNGERQRFSGVCSHKSFQSAQDEAPSTVLNSRYAVYPALAMAAMARPTGGGSSSEVNLAAPSPTCFTTIPGVAASAWLTRRAHEPQCIPSIFSVNSANSLPRVFI